VELVERFRSGDPDAVRDLYREFGRLVFAVTNRVLGDRGLAEEATQQTFVLAWRSAASFEAGRQLGPWLATIAKRAAIDIHRREARRPRMGFDDVAADDPNVVALPPDLGRIEEIWAVRQAIDSLPPDDRDLVRMQHLEGMTLSDIAERLGVPLGTIKSRTFRIHRQLAARLAHLRADGDEPTGSVTRTTGQEGGERA
jgi:RNA polymerase sigma-70 factor (ECF subfamily)